MTSEQHSIKKSGFRAEFSAVLAMCMAILAGALYMEFVMHLEPCLLCMSQRAMYLGIAFFAFLGVLHNPVFGGHRVYGFFISLFALGGIALAVRQLYLQGLPEDKVPACGPGFSYLVDNFPVMDILINMIKGSGSCAEVQFTFLGLSIPGWSLVGFGLLFCYGVYLFKRRTKIILLGK